MNIKIVTDVSKDNSASIFRVPKLITLRTLRDPERGGNTNLWNVGKYDLIGVIYWEIYKPLWTPKNHETRISVEG